MGSLYTPRQHVIVLVDDERDIRSCLVEALHGVHPKDTILEGANGVQELDLLRATRPDLLITDLRMPGLMGTDVIQVVRGTLVTPRREEVIAAYFNGDAAGYETFVRAHADLPIILTTANSMNAELGVFCRAHRVDPVSKPFDIDPLLAMVNRYLATGIDAYHAH